jgi:hypothetical protein
MRDPVLLRIDERRGDDPVVVMSVANWGSDQPVPSVERCPQVGVSRARAVKAPLVCLVDQLEGPCRLGGVGNRDLDDVAAQL